MFVISGDPDVTNFVSKLVVSEVLTKLHRTYYRYC